MATKYYNMPITTVDKDGNPCIIYPKTKTSNIYNTSGQSLDTIITNLNTAINGKASSSHTHSASQITGLGTAATKAWTSSITNGSTDLITSGAVYTGLSGKADSSTVTSLSNRVTAVENRLNELLDGNNTSF